MTRPSALTPAVQETYCEVLRQGGTRRYAAQIIGQKPEIVAQWLDRGRKAKSGKYRDFLLAVSEAMGDPSLRLGRSPRLTRELIEQIADLIGSQGLSTTAACERLGIKHGAFYQWMSKGRTAKTGLHFEFHNAITQARARFKSHHLTALADEVRNGRVVVKERTEIVRDGEGNVVAEKTVTETTTTKSGDAARWLLPRIFPDEFSERRILDSNVTVDDKQPRKQLELVVRHTGVLDKGAAALPEGTAETEPEADDDGIVEAELVDD